MGSWEPLGPPVCAVVVVVVVVGVVIFVEFAATGGMLPQGPLIFDFGAFFAFFRNF